MIIRIFVENLASMITPLAVTEIIDTIVSGYQPEKVIFFGSYARDKHTNDSDLDLLIVKDTDQSFVQRQRTVRSLFEKQSFPMDILIYTPTEFEKCKNWLNNIINIAIKTGKVVYERGN